MTSRRACCRTNKEEDYGTKEDYSTEAEDKITSKGTSPRAPQALVTQRNRKSYVRESQATPEGLTSGTETRPVRTQRKKADMMTILIRKALTLCGVCALRLNPMVKARGLRSGWVRRILAR